MGGERIGSEINSLFFKSVHCLHKAFLVEKAKLKITL